MKNMNQSEYAEFAARFKAACRAIEIDNLSQDEVGKRLGVSGPMISNYRNGRKLPSMDTACSICQITGVSLDWLMLGRGEMITNQVNTSLEHAWESASTEQRLNLVSKHLVKSDSSV